MSYSGSVKSNPWPRHYCASYRDLEGSLQPRNPREMRTYFREVPSNQLCYWELWGVPSVTYRLGNYPGQRFCVPSRVRGGTPSPDSPCAFFCSVSDPSRSRGGGYPGPSWSRHLLLPELAPYRIGRLDGQETDFLATSQLFEDLRVKNARCFNEQKRVKSVHNHHRKKIFWRTFLASKKNFPGRWWIQKPYKNQENHIHHRNLSSVDPIFSAKKSSALEQGGVCFLFRPILEKIEKHDFPISWNSCFLDFYRIGRFFVVRRWPSTCEKPQE